MLSAQELLLAGVQPEEDKSRDLLLSVLQESTLRLLPDHQSSWLEVHQDEGDGEMAFARESYEGPQRRDGDGIGDHRVTLRFSEEIVILHHKAKDRDDGSVVRQMEGHAP